MTRIPVCSPAGESCASEVHLARAECSGSVGYRSTKKRRDVPHKPCEDANADRGKAQPRNSDSPQRR